MSSPTRIQVLLTQDLAERFEGYCHKYGHKKSTLIAHLVREFLDREGFPAQESLFAQNTDREKRRA